ncbi:hypothetical protein [Krasilnikoviella flava]|uniref:Uncharacterized protein n=1 Tax=Krasilnikoviella flava TaxID=526729 RepID=A0A1T5KS68_9MICO|nr:hypothetical protein [Krasilnikoviella flava]SKC66473.1 hypothetical protein SAMN04324258_2327 [Krasilnikoviella flava]
MTLRSTIQGLRASAEVANDEHKVKMRTGEFVELADQLEPLLSKLPDLRIGLAEVRNLDVGLPPGLAQEITLFTAGLRALATELPSVGVDHNLQTTKIQVRSAVAQVAAIESLVADAWHEFRSQQPPPVNRDLVDTLARGGVDVEDIRKELETAQARLLIASTTRIPSLGAVQRFREAIEAIRRCGKRLGEVVDADIAKGIVGSQEPSGVPLAWFTPDRLERLRSLGVIDRFQVHLR